MPEDSRKFTVPCGKRWSCHVVSQNRGPCIDQNRATSYRPQYIIILIIGTPTRVSLILGNPGVGIYEAWKEIARVNTAEILSGVLLEKLPYVTSSKSESRSWGLPSH